jgi:hypothetical protein
MTMRLFGLVCFFIALVRLWRPGFVAKQKPHRRFAAMGLKIEKISRQHPTAALRRSSRAMFSSRMFALKVTMQTLSA